MRRQHLSLVQTSEMSRLRAKILSRAKLHTETVRRMIEDPSLETLELAGFLEDVANIYMTLSEELSAAVIAAQAQ